MSLTERWPLEGGAGLRDELLTAYGHPSRGYHDLLHLAEVLDRLLELGDAGLGFPTLPVTLAAWFHDAVYDPRGKDNESRSGELAVDLLGPIGVPGSTIERVVRLVRATAHLASADSPGDRDTAALLDADLAILGAGEERYRRYAADIRKEYAFVPDAEYRSGRAAVLSKFLARPRIFHHQMMFEEGETRARANVVAEWKELGG